MDRSDILWVVGLASFLVGGYWFFDSSSFWALLGGGVVYGGFLFYVLYFSFFYVSEFWYQWDRWVKVVISIGVLALLHVSFIHTSHISRVDAQLYENMFTGECEVKSTDKLAWYEQSGCDVLKSERKRTLEQGGFDTVVNECERRCHEKERSEFCADSRFVTSTCEGLMYCRSVQCSP